MARHYRRKRPRSKRTPPQIAEAVAERHERDQCGRSGRVEIRDVSR